MGLLAIAIFAGWPVPEANSQSRKPKTFDADIPFETLAPWFNRDHTAVEDEVTLRGTLHVAGKVWASSPTHVDRITIHLNAVDIHGTSETTGQRFRLNGAFSIDLRDPNVTFNLDGSFVLPRERFRLRLHKVDPEPARLDGWLDFELWTTRGDDFAFVYSMLPIPYADRVLAFGGAACSPTPCEVPDGATLFNGYAGDYNPPLFLDVRTWRLAFYSGVSVQWHCKTGNQEAPIIPVSGGAEYVKCNPLYSSTEPITVYADLRYDPYDENAYVSTPPRTYHMLERPPATPGLAGGWQAEGDAADATGSNPGMLVGNVTFVPGRVGSAFHFEGAGTVEAPASATLEPQTVTAMLWMRAPFFQPSTYLLSKGASACNSDSSYALFTQGDLHFYVSGGAPGTFSHSPPATADVWDGEWHHIAGTYDGASVRLYVDGVEQGAGNPAATSAINYALADNNVFRIGGYRSSCVDFLFSGDIDEVQVFSRALTATEIAGIYNGTP